MNHPICMLSKTYPSDCIAFDLRGLSGMGNKLDVWFLDSRGDNQRSMLRRWRWIIELHVCKLEEKASLRKD
jgi:hypothetical protein